MPCTGLLYSTGTSGTGSSAAHRPTAEDVLDGWTPTTSTLSRSPDAPRNDVYAGLANFPSDAGLAALAPDNLTVAGKHPSQSALSLTGSSILSRSSFASTALNSALDSATAMAEQAELLAHMPALAASPPAGKHPSKSAFSLTGSSPQGGSSFGSTALTSASDSVTAVAEQPELHTSMPGQPLCGPANGFPQDRCNQSILPER